MTRLFLTLFGFLFVLGHSFSQSANEPMTYGMVAPVDLYMTTFESDTLAPAVVLGEYGMARVSIYDDGAKLRTDFHRRIKILKRSGFDYGDVSIPFYSFKKKEDFIFDKAMVHLPGGRSIELKAKDVFIDQQNKYWSRATFTFPQLEVGCIVEYKYSITSESIYELTDWFFQEEIPVRYSEIQIDFPGRFAYSYLFQGNEGMQKTGEDDKGNEIYTGENGTMTLGKRRFVMENAPAMRPEGYITTMDDYRARIRFQLAEIQYYDGRIEKTMTTWENTKDDLDHHPYFGQQYLKKSKFKGMSEQLIPLSKGMGSEREKADFFYSFLAENLSWNGYFSLATRTEKLEDIFASGGGSSAELNFMLLVLLREADIEAYPIITSTRSNGKMYEDYPLIDQFNHTMVWTMIDGESLILDVTDPLRPPGYPNIEALNGRGVLIKDKKSPQWIDIVPPSDGTDIYMVEMSLDQKGNLTGRAANAYKGYHAISQRRLYHENASGAHWAERIGERWPGLDEWNAQNGCLEIIDTTFFDTLTFRIENAAQVTGEYIYISPIFYSSYLENPFKLEKRNYPVDIPYPFTEQCILTLNIPEGYHVEELPQNARYSLPDNEGLFHFHVSEAEPGTVRIVSRLIMKKLKFYPFEYPGVKELFDLVAEKFGEQVVLKKG